MAILLDPPRQRRDSLMIMKDLLENMGEPARLTHLLYRANLSYGQVKKYLDMLIQMELARQVSEPYRAFVVTEKGRAFIDMVESHTQRRWTKGGT